MAEITLAQAWPVLAALLVLLGAVAEGWRRSYAAARQLDNAMPRDEHDAEVGLLKLQLQTLAAEQRERCLQHQREFSDALHERASLEDLKATSAELRSLAKTTAELSAQMSALTAKVTDIWEEVVASRRRGA